MKQYRKYIEPRNLIGELHGYQQWYNSFTKQLSFRGNYKNNNPISYIESFETGRTRYHIR